MTEVAIRLTVNGEQHNLAVPARLTLADLLRDRLGLTGTHLGCEHGVCGACTVLLDGRTVRACITLAAQAADREVITIEGLSPSDGRLSRLQQAFSDEGGLQCGFCTPGFVVAATELLDEDPAADEATVRAALSGNLCRCTGYEGIVRATLRCTAGVAASSPSWADRGPPVGAAGPAAPPAAPGRGTWKAPACPQVAPPEPVTSAVSLLHVARDRRWLGLIVIAALAGAGLWWLIGRRVR